MIIVSAVHPFPGSSGQQQRVRHKLKAFSERFHTTFLTVAASHELRAVEDRLRPMCDETIVLPSLYRRSRVHQLGYLVRSLLHSAVSGLKRSNYVIGELELAPDRVVAAIGDRRFDLAVFEYWHAAAAVPVLRSAGARCVLDMHDVLWRSYDHQLEACHWLPSVLRRFLVSRYRAQEEKAWRKFDALITINREEHLYVREVLGEATELTYTPMGVDLDHWSYSWAPVSPPRVAYYGGLGGPHNRRDALFCFEKVMPAIWKAVPESELWIVGSNPPPTILKLPSRNPRVHVTGYVEDVASVLGTMSVVLCPWQGKFGFRSRVVEALATGAPVVATCDAVDGMGLKPEVDLLIADSAEEMAFSALALIQYGDLASRLSRSGRSRIENLYSFHSTYGELVRDLAIKAHSLSTGSEMPTTKPQSFHGVADP